MDSVVAAAVDQAAGKDPGLNGNHGAAAEAGKDQGLKAKPAADSVVDTLVSVAASPDTSVAAAVSTVANSTAPVVNGSTPQASNPSGSATSATPVDTSIAQAPTAAPVDASQALTNPGTTTTEDTTIPVPVDTTTRVGVAGVTLVLTGTDDQGNAVNVTTTTAADGSYTFSNLKPDNGTGYSITEIPPANLTSTAGPGTSTSSGTAANVITGIVTQQGEVSTNNDFYVQSSATVDGSGSSSVTSTPNGGTLAANSQGGAGTSQAVAHAKTDSASNPETEVADPVSPVRNAGSFTPANLAGSPEVAEAALHAPENTWGLGMPRLTSSSVTVLPEKVVDLLFTTGRLPAAVAHHLPAKQADHPTGEKLEDSPEGTEMLALVGSDLLLGSAPVDQAALENAVKKLLNQIDELGQQASQLPLGVRLSSGFL
ncbi:MAG: hypothetical protein JO112_14640, partial [Planctomycetes bacterium]|nr:hypothetical protein [Planctomycetota bacterium]